MKKIFLFVLLLAAGLTRSNAQLQSEKKHYPAGYSAGDVSLLEQWMESDGKQTASVFVVDVPSPGRFYVKLNTNMQPGVQQWLTADNNPTSLRITADKSGWQQALATMYGGATPVVQLSAGKHTLRFITNGTVAPLIDGISLSKTMVHAKLDAEWQQISMLVTSLSADKPASTEPLPKDETAVASKVLSNPAGNYEHAIDTAYTFSTAKLIYLAIGSVVTFETYSSTKDPVLHLFNPDNLAIGSWSDDDSGPGYESLLTVTIPVSGFYLLLARPYYGGDNGITNIKQNGVNLLTSTGIGGQRFFTASRSGDLNYFTCRLTGSPAPDTRIFTLTSSGGVVTGYNDDYFNSSDGNWEWNLASRIKKNYTAANSNYVFVCAYSAASAGKCDVYMGNKPGLLHSTEPSNFPLLANEDAIQSAPAIYDYQCIAWSGGITSVRIWPPDDLSLYNCNANNPLLCFDNYYSNSPVRYPGAWNYTRSGVTSANAVVDLWKRPGGAYQHASVTKPGNDHPHGYDWESKPGSLDRQFHPRNALENVNYYGVINDSYRSTGSFAKMAGAKQVYETDADAIKAGLAVYEPAVLTANSSAKLSSLLQQAKDGNAARFSALYEAWKKTWAAKLSLSNPDEFCKGEEYEQLEKWSMENHDEAMLFVFDKFIRGDQYIGKLLVTLTKPRYGKLLDDVKREALANPYDDKGRFRITGDHDNGVRYIEKILQQPLAATADEQVQDIVNLTVTASPNPVKDLLTIDVQAGIKGKMSVKVISSRTGITKTLLAETAIIAGSYQYRCSTKGIAGAAGDMLLVQVILNGEVKTVKLIKVD